MSVLDELKRQPKLFARCPLCSDTFLLKDARLFDVTGALPEEAQKLLQDRKQQLQDDRADLARRKESGPKRSLATAKSVNIGKMVEKIAPALPGFPALPSDCRSLMEPIDYLVFPGLSRSGEIKKVDFVEVKSGKTGLNDRQKSIKKAVDAGRVSLTVRSMPRST